MQVHSYRWDAPDRELLFLSPSGRGIWNNIHVLITGPSGGYKLRFSCAAWKDLEPEATRPSRLRIWSHSSPRLEEKWEVGLDDVDEDTVRQSVEKTLFEIHRVVGSWTVLPNHGSWAGDGLVEEKPAKIP